MIQRSPSEPALAPPTVPTDAASAPSRGRRSEGRYPLRFFVTCAQGTEGPLRSELVDIGVHRPTGDRGGVWFDGTFEDGMRVCLRARVAVRVLLELGSFGATGPDALYEGARQLEWPSWLDLERTFAVRATVRDSAITHSGFAALKLKDAIVDALRAKLGARPNVDTENPDVRVWLHLRQDQARILLDLAGEPLHRRGYRVAMTQAPLKETLAAAVLRIGRVPSDLPMIDPMAGSGTLAIEHALAARRIAPGLGRHFGFEHWPLFDEAMSQRWQQMKDEAKSRILPRTPAPVVCADASSSALDAARANATHAGVSQDLDFRLADIRQGIREAWSHATLCANPPYGQRMMGEPERGAIPSQAGLGAREANTGGVGELYAALSSLARSLTGWRVVVLSGNPDLNHAMRMRPQITHRLHNGDLEVQVLCYEMPESRSSHSARPRHEH